MLKHWQADFHLCCGRGKRCAVPDKSMQKPRGAGAGQLVPSSSSAHACVSPLAGLAGSVRATSPLHRYAMQTYVTSTKLRWASRWRRYSGHGERWLEPLNRDVVACRSQENAAFAHVCYDRKMLDARWITVSINLTTPWRGTTWQRCMVPSRKRITSNSTSTLPDENDRHAMFVLDYYLIIIYCTLRSVRGIGMITWIILFCRGNCVIQCSTLGYCV